MKKLFASKGRLALVLTALLLAITGTSWTAASAISGKPLFFLEYFGAPIPEEEEPESSSSPEEEPELPVEEEPEEEVAPVWAPVPSPDPSVFHMPGEMRGVYITPGVDFLPSQDNPPASLQEEIDTALDNAVGLTMNTAIIDTVYYDQTLYRTANSSSVPGNFDVMAYILEGCRARGLYVCAIFDASFYRETSGVAEADSTFVLTENLREFVQAYEVDAVLLDGYADEQADSSYTSYLAAGGAIGYEEYLRQTPDNIARAAVRTVRRFAPQTQIGLLADAVWANKDDNELGSLTKAAVTSLGTGNADTKGFLESGLFDFVAVKAFGSLSNAAEPFKEVVSWWGERALENDVPLYVVHASNKICTEEAGWAPHDQIARQVIEAEGVSGYSGSIFNNLRRLVENPKESAATLIKYYNKEVDPKFILTELQITKPEKTTYTTQEPSVTFTGASDPTSSLTINGEEIATDASGYFTLSQELKSGLNTFTFEHKEKVITYNITREILILKEMAPTGSLSAEGSMSIAISALAYHDAEVWAQIGGQSIPMEIDETADSEEDRDSNYRTFVGEFTVPEATAEVQNLGSIVVTATWHGEKMTLTGAAVSVNKKKKIEDGVPVVVVAEQAMTYPSNTVNNIPNANYYPLPKGAMDYAVGNEIAYTKDGKTYKYFVLASGMRIESKDIQAIGNDYPGNNVIGGYAVSSENGYTYVTLKTAQKISYSVKYAAGGITFTFHNTVRVPANENLNSNPLFSKATWSNDNTLTLSFLKNGGFMGYKGYYDNAGNLVLRFKNPPSSVSNARIAIDPGHGGKDTGALGFLRDYPERVLNRAVANSLVNELESRGATVLLLNTTNGMELDERRLQAERWNADLFLSVHHNTSAANAKATGTEVYYFYPYAYNLALNASKNVSAGLNTYNRGAKYSYYHVTLSSQMPSVLVECGFMSNKGEYEKLIRSEYQKKIAEGIANAVATHIKQVYSGGGSGTQSVGNVKPTDGTTSEGLPSGGVSGGDIVFSNGDNVEFEFAYGDFELRAGESETLIITADGDEQKNSDFKWKSSNSAVAGVTSGGKVTAKKAGTAKITATSQTYEGVELVCTVTVVDEGGTSIDISALEAVEMDMDELPMVVGEKQPLVVLPYPDNIDGLELVWNSSDTAVAKVDQQGNVTALQEGEAEITATVKANTRLVAVCVVYVSG